MRLIEQTSLTTHARIWRGTGEVASLRNQGPNLIHA
jgi:hypothetical protein